jgi:hypothetical protein
MVTLHAELQTGGRPMVIETTLRRERGSPNMVAVRCAGSNAKTDRRCNHMLGWVDGWARFTCSKCRTTLVYHVMQGEVRAATDMRALTMLST